MTSSLSLIFHISAGTIGLLSGTAALCFAKGSRPHRMAGNVFFISVLALAASTVFLGLLKSKPGAIVTGGFLVYLATTAWATVKRKEGETGRFEIGAAIFAVSFSLTQFFFGFSAVNSESGTFSGEPAGVYFIFGVFGALAAAFDFRMIKRGGLFGVQRIIRHFGRMCYILLMGSGSIFLGNPQVFPDAVRETNILYVPVIGLFLATIFWLVRVRFTSWYQKNRIEEKAWHN